MMPRKGTNKREVIQFRATPEEAESVRAKAQRVNITVAQFVRNCVLGIPFSIVDLECLDLLRRLGTLLKLQVEGSYDTPEVEKTLVAFQELSRAIIDRMSVPQQKKKLTAAEKAHVLAGIDEAIINDLELLAEEEYADVNCKIREQL